MTSLLRVRGLRILIENVSSPVCPLFKLRGFTMTHRLLITLVLASLSAIEGLSAERPLLPPAAAREIDFVRDIQPIFRARCLSCHDGAKQRGGLRLDLKSAAFKGGETFASAIIPGKSADSPLVRLVAGLEEGLQMPPEGERVSGEQIGLLRAWIDQGAKWPDEAAGNEDAASHWSFRPVKRPELPSVSRDDASWVRNPVDAFVASKLDAMKPDAMKPDAFRSGCGRHRPKYSGEQISISNGYCKRACLSGIIYILSTGEIPGLNLGPAFVTV